MGELEKCYQRLIQCVRYLRCDMMEASMVFGGKKMIGQGKDIGEDLFASSVCHSPPVAFVVIGSGVKQCETCNQWTLKWICEI